MEQKAKGEAMHLKIEDCFLLCVMNNLLFVGSFDELFVIAL
jgi:hypothetical protein